ncbi:MAG TPA: TlpA disulfide reductase family protein [Phnomibacter sp.]|nr:TlpA disulfide reductase family protein [Phnomibacter sp.]
MKYLILLVMLGGVNLLAKAQDEKGVTSITYKNYKEVPAFNLLDLNEKKFSSGSVQQKGKSLVVVYFSPMCGHCLEFTENLTSQLKKFKQVQFLFVSAYPMNDIKTFAITRGLNKMPQFKIGQDPDFNMGRFYELKEIPAIFVYSKNGRFKKSFDSKVKIEDLIAEANAG